MEKIFQELEKVSTLKQMTRDQYRQMFLPKRRELCKHIKAGFDVIADGQNIVKP